jgi:hypothetical protein
MISLVFSLALASGCPGGNCGMRVARYDRPTAQAQHVYLAQPAVQVVQAVPVAEVRQKTVVRHARTRNLSTRTRLGWRLFRYL